MEKEKFEVEETVAETTAPSKKKNLKWLWITLALTVLAGVLAWCIYSVLQVAPKDVVENGVVVDKVLGVEKFISIAAFLFGVFVITALGYLLGRITIKGVSLGTAGVFLVAILFGLACTYIPKDLPILGSLRLEAGKGNTVYYKSVLQNVGLVLFVGSVGFIAGPKFFRDLKKNFKTYILMGIVIILAGTAVAVAFALIPGIGSEFSAGVLSGALTSTPGYSAALEVAGEKSRVGNFRPRNSISFRRYRRCIVRSTYA